MSRSLGTLTLDLVAELSEFRKGFDQATRIAENHKREMMRIMNDMERRQNAAIDKATRGFKALAGIAASVAAVSTVSGIIDMADSYGQMSARIKLTIEDMNEYEYVQQRLMKTANEAQRPLEEMQNIFIDTSGNLRDMGYSLEQAMDIADSFSFALVRNATDAQRAASALRAYDTALNKGRVDAMMWQSISSALPSLEVSMSKIFNVPLQKIQQMGFEGKITVDMLNKAFLRAYEDNKSAAESMGSTVSGSFTAVQNQIKAYIGELNESAEVTDKISKSIQFLGDNVDTIAKTFGVVAVGGISLYSAKLVAMTATNIKAAYSTAYKDIVTRKHKLTLIEEAKAQEAKILADINAIKSNASLANSYSLLTAKTWDYHRALSLTQKTQEATRSLFSILSAPLGGPVGLISLVASAASAFYLFSDSAKETKIDIEALNTPLDEILSKFKELNHIQRDKSVRDYQNQEFQAQKELAEERDKFWKKLSSHVVKNTPNGNYMVTEIRAELKEILKEAEATGRDIALVINDQAKKYNFSQQAIDELTDIGASYDDQIKKHSKIKNILDNVLGLNEDINKETKTTVALLGNASILLQDIGDFTGPIMPDNKEYLKDLDEIFKKREEIIAKAEEERLVQQFLAGELTEIEDIERARLAYEQQINDELLKNIQNTTNITRKMEDLEDRVAKVGMSYKEAFIYDLKKAGATDDQITEATKKLDTLATKTKEIKARSKATVDINKEYKRVMESILSDEERRGLELQKNLEILRQYGASEADMLAVRRAAYESMSVDLPGYDGSGNTLTAQLTRINENISELDQWRELQLKKIQQAYGDEENALAESIARKEEIEQQYRERRSQYEGEMNQELLNIAHNLTSDSLSALEAAGMEASGIYKAMFLANKAAAFANAIISAQEAGAKALAVMPGPAGIALSKMITGIGLANAGIIAATGLKGMAHSGIDKVPETGTWLLEKGERVVTANTSARLDAVLENISRQRENGSFGNQTPQVNSSVSVVITNEGTVEQRQDDTGGNEIARVIEGKVVEVIVKELRPGGILAKRG